MDANDRENNIYSSFGLFRDGEVITNGTTYSRSRRFQLSFAVVAVALLIVTGVFVALQVTRSTKEATTKAKRYVRDGETTTKAGKVDVDLVPEAEAHPNHRYESQQSRDQIAERMTRKTYHDWSPGSGRNNIRDIIGRGEIGIGKPILFRGVYRKRGDEDDGDRIREINEMLSGERSPTEERHHRGSPFQLRSQADVTTGNGSEEFAKLKKPITVVLDIYPLTKPEVDDKSIGNVRKQPDGSHVAAASGSSVAAYASLPVRKAGRMIMQLNLFPKRRIAEPEVMRRTFGWFKKEEDEDGWHECRLIGRKRRPISAEWKDEHGDWVRSNHVTLKYWDRK